LFSWETVGLSDSNIQGVVCIGSLVRTSFAGSSMVEASIQYEVRLKWVSLSQAPVWVLTQEFRCKAEVLVIGKVSTVQQF